MGTLVNTIGGASGVAARAKGVSAAAPLNMTALTHYYVRYETITHDETVSVFSDDGATGNVWASAGMGFVAPADGIYHVVANAYVNDAWVVVTGLPFLNIVVDTAVRSSTDHGLPPRNGTYQLPLSIVDDVELSAGEKVKISIQPASGSNTVDMGSSGSSAYFAIHQVK